VTSIPASYSETAVLSAVSPDIPKFLHIPAGIVGLYLKSNYDRFLPRHLQFINHFYNTIRSYVTNAVEKASFNEQYQSS
jgi:hypothetical protein